VVETAAARLREPQGQPVPTLDAAACAGLMDELTRLAVHAAETILGLAGKHGVRSKSDGSPVTAADEASEAVICEGIARIAPGVPIISEERAAQGPPEPPERGSYFLVDPLDGTREFIAGRGEYTVNIALLTDRVPMLGVICAPALTEIWRGIIGGGAARFAGLTGRQSLPIHARPAPKDETIVMVSRSHLDAKTQDFVGALTGARTISSGSSIKFCRIAEGKADLYPRLAPTHDWDIAAGHAILVAAGGSLMTPDGKPVLYGSKTLTIPAFIARGSA
jgi:3'(2'), 5'-bisphosphate nucleotidase